jgi:hypothetical protein
MSAETRARAIEALLDCMPTEVMAALVAEKIADLHTLLIRCIEAASPPTPAKH